MRKQTLFLLLVFLAGFSILSAMFRLTQTPTRNEVPPFSDPSLTERQKIYLDRQSDLSKWMIALSYGLLAGLVTKRLSGDDPRFSTFTCALGAVLLLLSLYSGFLSYQSVLIVMSLQPLWTIGSHLTSFPLAAQMILLVAATTILTWVFLAPNQTPKDKKGKP